MRILRAFNNAKHLVGLKRGEKDTLAELCRFLSQNRPFDTIFAHKTTIAARIGVCERTIYRHLSTLQAHCLIEVLEQDRKSRNGRFTVSRIRLTKKTAVPLGLIDTTEEAPNKLRNAETINPLKAENKEGIIHSLPSDNLSDGYILSIPTISKNQPYQRTKNGLPIDLTWMAENGLSRAGNFKLMGKAKIQGKRLSDFSTAAYNYIKDLKGGYLYVYLAKLVEGPSDFTIAARNEKKHLIENEKKKALKQKEQLFRSRFRNTTLTNRNQTHLYVIDSQGRFAQVFGEGPGTTPLNNLTAWIQGMKSGNLMLATWELEQRLMR